MNCGSVVLEATALPTEPQPIYLKRRTLVEGDEQHDWSHGKSAFKLIHLMDETKNITFNAVLLSKWANHVSSRCTKVFIY